MKDAEKEIWSLESRTGFDLNGKAVWNLVV